MSSVGSSTGYVFITLFLYGHHPDKSTRIVFGIYTIGSLTGAIPASYLVDRFGRRFAMFCGNLLIVIGAVVTANAKNREMFIGGRYLTGQYILCADVSH